MAIKKTRLIRDFYPKFQRNSVLVIIIFQILAIIGVAVILILSELAGFDSILLWIILIAMLLVNIISGVLIFKQVSRPLKDIMDAIIYISGEPTIGALPNPNDKRYEKTGFREALQTIYKLSSGKTKSPDGSMTENNSAIPLGSLDTIGTGIVMLDHNRRIIYRNKNAPVTAKPQGDLVLDLTFNGINDNMNTWLDKCTADAVRASRIWKRIPDKSPSDKSRRFFDVIASYEKGRVAETILVLVDRTATYKIDENNLNFIAFAAHELRGPITVIKGYLDVLEDELEPVLKEDQHELFRRLTVSANRLSGYVNNILNTSNYDQRHLKTYLVEDTVAQVYDAIADDMKLRASAENRILNVNFPSDLPTIAADRSSLSEVLSNLIDNAIKYSNEGGVINVTAEEKGDHVEISVEDHGIGMPPDVVGNLFHKFYRSHRSRETVAGTGIGLYVSKAIVESHGGTISVRSREGYGSTFTVSLPKYSIVADKLAANDNSNESMIKSGSGWIKNHSMYRG